MKILAVSDQIIERLYTAGVRDNYPDVRMIIGCGDLPYSYLEFLVTVFNVPMYYVPGNHDPEYDNDNRSRAEGGINLDLKIAFSHGLFMAGIGGSIVYHPGTPNQYSQAEMYQRAIQLLPTILWNQYKHRRRLDLLIAHSPPFGVHDDDDPAHNGLKALNWLIRMARPRYMLHGHTIFYRQNLHDHITTLYDTQIVNIYPFRILEI
jgi:hypothetical protein